MRRGAGRRFTVAHKGVVNIVTSVDKAAERAIRRVIAGSSPTTDFDGGIGRPSVALPYRWVVDPLDGTVNFAHGLPISCVSIGLEKDGRVILGGVLDPYRRELFTAARGRARTSTGGGSGCRARRNSSTRSSSPAFPTTGTKKRPTTCRSSRGS
ncbi:MAG: hypothetical protein IPH91_10750 [Elusimicrobia bacterium]|nr:hypothetical protein [Elusimicrobiota bacterium]